ncbi:hypothetical protein EI42_04821 [Thermosporothrix hazakensis]|jgi:hypothetical protein|uniref:Uncharacterized protein n=1 Tax=Thermosporothrix hazakensis TaxID=644383 RepID=A0A326U163_THEHA|nr:hypothetical protein [Thermosporothrix hazakensis]PZW23898.1 hypothetical protein EI42_04821 [Thermosporothrix hazakensis]GCE48503.1 hypothetical protein KTH_33720 [Thermosporothrix hazakensis]
MNATNHSEEQNKREENAENDQVLTLEAANNLVLLWQGVASSIEQINMTADFQENDEYCWEHGGRPDFGGWACQHQEHKEVH